MAEQSAILGAARLGNFRLGAISTAEAAVRATAIRILLGGVEARVRIAGLTIRDILNDAPNTCTLTIDDQTPPTDGQALRITIGADAQRLLFAGTLQDTNLSYEGRPGQLVWPATAIDHTARLNRRRPFGTFVAVSATTIAQALVTTYAPAFTTTHIAAALPTVSIIFDGTDTFMGCLTRLATAVGGYCKVEDLDVYLFQTDTDDAPDPIDDTPGRFLDDPPITCTRDLSQLQTRVFGKGYGAPVPGDVLAGETIVPLPDVTLFNPAGGRAIAGTTADGAQSQILAYTGVHLGGAGSLVGPGAAPATAPTLVLASGTGLSVGVYQYAYTDVTAAGESLPSPLGTITTGTTAAPATTPTPSAPIAGGAVDGGGHDYVVTFITASGETTPSSVSASVQVVETPTVAPTFAQGVAWPSGSHTQLTNAKIKYAFLYAGAVESLPSPESAPATIDSVHGWDATIPVGGVGVIGRRVYMDHGTGTVGGFFIYQDILDNTTTAIANHAIGDTYFYVFLQTLGSPQVTAKQQIPLTTIPLGAAAVTSRKLYRRFNGTGTFKLVETLGDNVTTTYADTKANASLGAAAPSSNTAIAQQVTVTGVAVGPAGTTGRRLYRTQANGSQLRLWAFFADNTSTGGTDANSDASIAGNAIAPTSDDSGLVQPSGQINAGSTTILTASPAPFASSGGWALVSGDQAVRYTGISGNTLTGVPASGPGALLTTVLYGSQILPSPALAGVTGLALAMAKGTPVHIWVQRDDLEAQAEQAVFDAANGITPADGIYEGPPVVDTRRGEASLIALCDVHLQLFARPIVTVTVASRDVRMVSGKTLVVDLDTPLIHETLTIQDVTIDQIGVAPGTPPRFMVTASSVRFSLEDLLRKLAA
jgi:hypothetical protein